MLSDGPVFSHVDHRLGDATRSEKGRDAIGDEEAPLQRVLEEQDNGVPMDLVILLEWSLSQSVEKAFCQCRCSSK